MRKLECCPSCPASSVLKDRFQHFISVYADDYIRAGDVLLEDYLILADGVERLHRSPDEDDRPNVSAEVYDRAARSVSLSLIYLSQIEAGLDYVNAIDCPEVDRSTDCPRLNAVLTILGSIRRAMLNDIGNDRGTT